MGLGAIFAAAQPLTALSTAAAGAGNVWGTVYANRANQREADANRAFQANMSNTAYQRAMQDMEAAGLNPMLGLTHQASTPTGAMATHQAPQFGEIVSSALSGMKLLSELDHQDAQTAMTRAAIPGVAAQSTSHIANAGIADAIAGYLVAQASRENNANELYYNRQRIAAVKKAEGEARLTVGDADIQEFGPSRYAKEGHLYEEMKAGLRQELANATLAEMQIPGRKAKAASDDTWYGRHVRPYLSDIFGGSGAANATGVFRSRR